MNTIPSAIEPERTLTPTYRLRYRHTPPLHTIAGTADDKRRGMQRIRTRYAQAIKVMRGLSGRNREAPVSGRILQEYYCIGCDVGDGDLRTQVLQLAAYPLVQVAMQEILAEQLTLQCYFDQTYEDIAGKGPGGIIGTLGWGQPDTSAERCYVYGNWVSDNLPQMPYPPSDFAEAMLWKDSFKGYSRGKYWLMNLPQNLPHTGVYFPPELKHNLMALLGVVAMQRLVTKHLGRDFVLLDDNHIIERKHLHWSLAL